MSLCDATGPDQACMGTPVSRSFTLSSQICRRKSGSYLYKGEIIGIVASKDARPASEYQSNVSEFPSSRRGGLQKDAQKVLARIWMFEVLAYGLALQALLPLDGASGCGLLAACCGDWRAVLPHLQATISLRGKQLLCKHFTSGLNCLLHLMRSLCPGIPVPLCLLFIPGR